jgi:general secretion pathway protein G
MMAHASQISNFQFPISRFQSPISKHGFTLLELLGVIAIIAILIGLGAKGYNLASRQSKESRARAELETWRLALDEYRVEYGAYPAPEPPETVRVADVLPEGLVEGTRVTDPWGRDYLYFSTNRFRYTLWSVGHDPEFDGDDITSEKAGY